MEQALTNYVDLVKVFSVHQAQRALTKDEMLCYNGLLAMVQAHSRMVQLSLQDEISKMIDKSWPIGPIPEVKALPEPPTPC